MSGRLSASRRFFSASFFLFCSAFAFSGLAGGRDSLTDIGERCAHVRQALPDDHPAAIVLDRLQADLQACSRVSQPGAELVSRVAADISALAAHLPRENTPGNDHVREIAAIRAAWRSWCVAEFTSTSPELKANAAGLYSGLSEVGERSRLTQAELFWRDCGALDRARAEGQSAAQLENALAAAESSLAALNAPPQLPEASRPVQTLSRCAELVAKCRVLIGIMQDEAQAESPTAAQQQSATKDTPPRGELTHCFPGTISGWVWDPDRPQQPLAVVMRVNGDFAAAGTANLPVYGIEELANAPSNLHGFFFERFDFPKGNNRIEIFATDPVSGEQVLIGSGAIAMP